MTYHGIFVSHQAYGQEPLRRLKMQNRKLKDIFLANGSSKMVLRHLNGTSDLGVWIRPVTDSKLIVFEGGDWAGSLDDGKNTSGYGFSHGSGMFCWNSRK
ncbi:hypothetical protein K1719_028152 [Acacia pycnantha]|nr:hypothetical protein K1719_028152 [Acacia pycnantha]